MEHLTQIFHDLVVHLGYPGLFIVMFLGNIGTPVGTEVVMPTAGALAAQGHFPSLAALPAWMPSCGADRDARPPPRRPNGVRAAPRMTVRGMKSVPDRSCVYWQEV